MKKLFLIVIFALSSTLSAQVTSGIITYGLSFETDTEFAKDAVLGDYYKSAVDNAKYLSYNLEFNQEAMHFYEVPNMSVAEGDLSFAKSFSGCYGSFYKGKNDRDVLNSLNDERFGALIISINGNREWEMTSETKMINGFLCYRANSFEIVNNETRIFRHPVIAWYCPVLPFSYGPMQYGGLPGLILGLQVRNVVFGVTKIDRKPKKEIIISKPSKGKFYTNKEYDDMLKKGQEDYPFGRED